MDPDPKDPQDEELFHLFEALRTHVVQITHDFADRVSSRIDQLSKDDRFSAPSLLQIFGRALLESTNVVASFVPLSEKRDSEEEPE